MKFRKKMTAILLTVIFMISTFAVAITVSANTPVALVEFDPTSRIPSLEGSISYDDTNLYFSVTVYDQDAADDDYLAFWIDPDYLNKDLSEMVSQFDSPWNEYSKLLMLNFYYGTDPDPRWGDGSGGNCPWMQTTTSLPEGVSLTYIDTSEGMDWEGTIPLSLLGLSEGDTIGYMFSARIKTDAKYVDGYPETVYGYTPGWDLRDYALVTIPAPALAMDSFIIEHAKIDFKKKIDDDKVKIKGHFVLDLGNGDGVSIEDEVTLTISDENVEVFSQTILMVEKGKGEKWEYKRPKGETGGIKHMKIHWKNEGLGKFDVKIDGKDVDLIMNPVTIKLEIGDHVGEDTIAMRVHKHHWDYKAKGK